VKQNLDLSGYWSSNSLRGPFLLAGIGNGASLQPSNLVAFQFVYKSCIHAGLNLGTDYFSKTRYNFNALGRVAQLVRALP
jgi:hypothetical protein